MSSPPRDASAPFVSYAQNFEDVLLWRALNDHGPGFYIDVGAGDPVAESVTKAFYERGWRGINVEPMAQPIEGLRRDRPRDINLELALEDAPGTRTYFSVDGGNGLSTGVEEHAERYRAEGWTVAEVSVSVDTLATVCRTYVQGEIHFLKVDVEGSEHAVLTGGDFDTFRPWILVIEATLPNTQVSTAGAWEKLVTDADYQPVFFDGLNRYYVAGEKASLLAERLSTPANVLDNFVLASTVRAHDEAVAVRADLERTLEELDFTQQQVFEGSRHVAFLARNLSHAVDQVAARDRHIEDLAVRIGGLETNLAAAGRSIDEVRTELADVYRSRSWRLTRPLRAVVRKAGGLRGALRARRGRSI